MKSFAMLETGSHSGDHRYFIDGKRVGRAEYRKLLDHAKRQDSFQSVKKGNRYHNHSVCYL